MRTMEITAVAISSVDSEIGPRRPGAIYQNPNGRFEVLAVVVNPTEATKLLRTTARWAVIVRDILRPDAQPVAVGSAWAAADYLIRSANYRFRPTQLAFRPAA